MSNTEQKPVGVERRDPASPHTAGRVAGMSRFLTAVPVLGLMVSAIVLVVVAAVDTFHLVIEAAGGHLELKSLVVESIELADVFLLAVVLYIMALGLFSLFIDDRIPLPKWLEIHTLDDLKEKLIGVVIVVLAVFFLGRVIEAKDYQSLMFLGFGISAIIFTLSYFVGRVIMAHDNE